MPLVVIATGFGGPEVLSVVDEPTPAPQDGEVLLVVRAAGVNPIDHKFYSGAFGRDPAQLPMRLGLEASGVVTAVGPGATGPGGPIAVGDEVIGYPLGGAYAAEVVAPGSSFVPKPVGMAWDEAAGLMVGGTTAEHLLTATDVGRGDTVLIHGAAGGVGVLAVQLTVARGARVIATASAARHDVLRELGAEPVVYGDGLADRVRALAPDGVDAALDLVGTDEAVDVSLELVADRARIATIAGFQRGFAEGIKVLGGGQGADPGDEIRAAARLDLVRLVKDGALKVIVSKTFPLVEAADAHRESLGGHGVGKIVLIPTI